MNKPLNKRRASRLNKGDNPVKNPHNATFSLTYKNLPIRNIQTAESQKMKNMKIYNYQQKMAQKQENYERELKIAENMRKLKIEYRKNKKSGFMVYNNLEPLMKYIICPGNNSEVVRR